MNFLNSGKGYLLYEYEAQKDAYVDKSLMIQKAYSYARQTNKYICVTRPRRFGKSTAANMVAAFFEKCHAKESRELFKELAIGGLRDQQEKRSASEPRNSYCWPLQGKCNVIRINMIEMQSTEVKSWRNFEDTFNRRMREDLSEAYPNIQAFEVPIPEALERTGEQFIFVLDEWDAIFEMKYMSQGDKEEYLQLLKNLLKDRSYVHFAYMTGILPIAKYSSGSPLNMFDEFSAFQDEVFYPYFGLTRDEIQHLMDERGYTTPSVEELSLWYDGYIREMDQEHIYNPNSVSKALANGRCRSYWTGTGPMNEVRDMIQHNVQDLREDVIRMAGGETLDIELTGFSVEKTQVSTRDEILSAMVVYGFLSYHEKRLCIPNHELMLKFREALSAESMGLKQTIDASQKLVNATLERNHEEVARMIEELHDEKIPFFQYNDENSLACVVVMGYLAALDRYQISREEKAGKGFVDFSFTPMKKGDIPVILELKYNHSAQNALDCIHERGYLRKYSAYPRVLLVGINYSEATKKHTCLTELIEQ